MKLCARCGVEKPIDQFYGHDKPYKTAAHCKLCVSDERRELYARRGAQIKERVSSYFKTPQGRYQCQKQAAKDRGIAWTLTFEQWWGIWQSSGHWSSRGRNRGQYVMARRGDVGPYALGNVYICTNTENCRDAIKKSHVTIAAVKALQQITPKLELAATKLRVA